MHALSMREVVMSRRRTWKVFRKRVEPFLGDLCDKPERSEFVQALDTFEQWANPKYVSDVTREMTDVYEGVRRRTVPAAIAEKDIMHLRISLKVAVSWGYLSELPIAASSRSNRSW